MISSGETAKATTSDAAVVLLPANGGLHHQLTIVNESGIAGFFSVDGGTVWCRWPTGAKARTISVTLNNQTVYFKRVAGSTDVTGLFADAA